MPASSIRFVYRHLPWVEIWGWSVTALLGAIMLAFLLERIGVPAWPLAGAAVVLAALIRIAFFRRIVLVVQDDTLVIVRQALAGWPGSSEIICAGEFRHVRYSREIEEVIDSDGDKMEETYFRLDIITTGSRIVPVIRSTEPFRRVARDLARALRAHHEEYLE